MTTARPAIPSTGKTLVERTFKVGDEFRTNSSLTRDELPVLQHLTQKAYDWILEKEAEQTEVR